MPKGGVPKVVKFYKLVACSGDWNVKPSFWFWLLLRIIEADIIGVAKLPTLSCGVMALGRSPPPVDLQNRFSLVLSFFRRDLWTNFWQISEDFGEEEGDREGRLVFAKESQATASADLNMGEISEGFETFCWQGRDPDFSRCRGAVRPYGQRRRVQGQREEISSPATPSKLRSSRFQSPKIVFLIGGSSGDWRRWFCCRSEVQYRRFQRRP
ncbi:hypothetical protein U1Q18_036939 [Sarracenia purpurea var. burkii]